MKPAQILILTIFTGSLLSGCSSIETVDVASACEQGIEGVNQRLQTRTLKVHQTNISRANSLMIAAEVQLQFAEYPGCLEKVQRAKDYLNGQQTAIISRSYL